MAITGFDQVTERLEPIQLAFETAVAVIDAAIAASGVASVQQLEALRRTLAGVMDNTRALMDDLDALDPVTLITVPDGSRTIDAWIWQRTTRFAILDVHRLARELDGEAAEQIRGANARIVLVREGDTWQTIAARTLGDWTEWPRLVAANPGASVSAPAIGSTLLIPDPRAP